MEAGVNMPDREEVLRQALQAGIDVLREHLGDDEEYVLANVPTLLEVMWPYIESYHERHTIKEFEKLFATRFPNHVITNYGGSVFDYIVGNVQTAVVEEIILMMETWAETLKEAATNPKFQRETESRDWEVALAHTNELISEVRQYRTRGSHGPHVTHTGSVATSEDHARQHSDEL